MKVTRGDITGIAFILPGCQNSYYAVGDFYKDGGEQPSGSFELDDRLVKAIVAITDFYRVNKLAITSTYRSQAHNEYLKSQGYEVSEHSLHMEGKAADFVFKASVGDKLHASDAVMSQMYVDEIRARARCTRSWWRSASASSS